MPSCAAFVCTNHSNENKTLKFHQIPDEGRNKQLWQQWSNNIRRAGELPKDKSFYICSEHFEDDCYERDLKVSVLPHFERHLITKIREYMESCESRINL